SEPADTAAGRAGTRGRDVHAATCRRGDRTAELAAAHEPAGRAGRGHARHSRSATDRAGTAAEPVGRTDTAGRARAAEPVGRTDTAGVRARRTVTAAAGRTTAAVVADRAAAAVVADRALAWSSGAARAAATCAAAGVARSDVPGTSA